MKKNSKLSLESYLKEDYLNDQTNLSKHYINKEYLEESANTSGVIYIYREKRTVSWIDIVNKLAKTSKTIAGEQIENIKGVVLLKLNDRVFALSFSNGISLIKNDRLETEFGLQTNRKLVKQKDLKTIKTVSLSTEIISNHKRAKTKIPYNLQLNNSPLNIVNDVSGPVAHEVLDIDGLKMTVSGQNQIQLKVNQHPNFPANVLKILRKLLEIYEDEDSKDQFKWKNEIIRVKDKSFIKKLNKKLAEKIRMMIRKVKEEDKNGNSINEVNRDTLRNIELHVDPPYSDNDPIYGFQITGLGFPGKRIFKGINEIYLFSQLALILGEQIDQPAELRTAKIISKLESITINYYLSSDIHTPIYLSKMYDTIYFETTIPKETKHKYILFQGKWHKIPRSYLNYLEEEINSIPSDTLGIEYMDFTNEHYQEITVQKTREKKIQRSEGAYNYAMSETEELVLFDKKNYKLTAEEADSYNLNKSNAVEPCDLFKQTDETIQLIHVKIGKSGSGFSHLLNQAYASSVLYKYESKFKEHMDQVLEDKKCEKLSQNVNHKKTVIVLACIVGPDEVNKSNSNVFPLLAATNIINTVTEINKLGFDCHLVKIANKYNND